MRMTDNEIIRYNNELIKLIDVARDIEDKVTKNLIHDTIKELIVLRDEQDDKMMSYATVKDMLMQYYTTIMNDEISDGEALDCLEYCIKEDLKTLK